MLPLALEDLLSALGLADAACATDGAWDAIYAEIHKRYDEDTGPKPEHFPESAEMREDMHTKVHSVINNVLAAGAIQMLGGGGPLGFGNGPAPSGLPFPSNDAPTLPKPEDGDDRPGMYL